MTDKFHTDGSGAPSLFWDFPDPDSGETHAHMNGVDVMQFALTRVPGLVRSLRSGFDEAVGTDAWTAVYLHQANVFAVNHLARMCAMDGTRFPVAIERTGNTGPASIPLCISHDAIDHGLGVSALVGFGVGWSWGGVVVDQPHPRAPAASSLSVPASLPVIGPFFRRRTRCCPTCGEWTSAGSTRIAAHSCGSSRGATRSTSGWRNGSWSPPRVPPLH